MTSCKEIRSQLTFYLDDELDASDCSDIESHLQTCRACAALFQEQRRFLSLVRDGKSQLTASPELRGRVMNILVTSSETPAASPQLRHRVRRLLRLPAPRFAVPALARYLIPAALMATVLALGIWLRFSKKVTPPRVTSASEFAQVAAATHLRHLRGQLPLEISSALPGELSAWFVGKVPFLVKLPNYQESSGQEKLYQLEGARLVSYRSDYAAYVAYQMHSRPISLVITSESMAQPEDGEEIVAKGITFHYNSINGLKVITWSDRGLTYALVSDLEERGQESCIVCHQGSKDRDFIESLKPR
jgi:anti-sigma factor RsiW